MPDTNSFGMHFDADMFRIKVSAFIIWAGIFCSGAAKVQAQGRLLGADLSYVNEMEDCGVTYLENHEARDLYDLLEDHGCALARFRLWHTPSWYDQLNQGKRYSDLPDVMRSIKRAREHHMQVLLDFQLSDFWADPSRQWAPSAWSSVIANQAILEDSLYEYVRRTLLDLHAAGLLPEMVQIGNETNRDILLAPGVDAPWELNWSRNAPLFNTAIDAVRQVSSETGSPIRIALHIAGPQNVEWYTDGFIEHGVTDFDVIGMSYYWPYHQPVTIGETGKIIGRLRQRYPDKEVMVLETGCIWTTASSDQAVNVLNEIEPGYGPPDPQNQAKWLIELTKEVYRQGGSGVIYWEPGWVSSGCRTYWGQGSHYENAAFFDFDHNLLAEGGIRWLEYDFTTAISPVPVREEGFQITFLSHECIFTSEVERFGAGYSYQLIDVLGRIVQSGTMHSLDGTDHQRTLPITDQLSGWVTCILLRQNRVVAVNAHWAGL